MNEPLEIAVGKSRKSITWQNKKIEWTEFIDRLREPHRTHESFAEYTAAKKTRRDEIKDVGGFVGGHLVGGRRKSTCVDRRSMLTLDADSATADFWMDVTLCYTCEAVIYSTHSHSAAAPRYRLIIPLSRSVSAAEYEAISRRVASTIGMSHFDPTTFQPERLMYWPSASKDGEYEFRHQAGPWLDADAELATYSNWKDLSEWPVHDGVEAIINRSMKKQGDPLSKGGLIGAFNRAYSIHDAIEKFLSDVYEPVEGKDGRYSYKLGSTAGGLVTYDDKFAFSHHGTDPAGGKLLNSFDLVRLHQFGLRDDEAKPDTPVNKLPSFAAMSELAASDKRVIREITESKLAQAQTEFGDDLKAGAEDEPVDDSWKENLDVDRKGFASTINNLVLMLENDPAIRGAIGFDEFEQRPVFRKAVKWRDVSGANRYITDSDVANLENLLENTYQISTAKMEKALLVVYSRNRFHAVRNYLNSLVWDGTERVDRLLIDYMGAEDTEYTRAVTRKTLCAAIARVFRPGIKFDNVLTLVGPEGVGKSTLFSKLGRGWFSDTFSMHMLQSKEGYEQLRGAWIIELAELAGMAKTEVERVKAFLSAREDRYRPAYGRRIEAFPRQCIAVASTNKDTFLKSQTGNRRFWPVPVQPAEAAKSAFKDLSGEEVNQIWAEAYEFYKAGESLYLPKSIEMQAIDRQRDHTEEHPWTNLILNFCDQKVPENWNSMNKYERLDYLNGDHAPEKCRIRDRVCVLEIWDECIKRREAIDKGSAEIIRDILRNSGCWEEQIKPMKFGKVYGTQRRGFKRTNTAEILGYKPVTTA